MPIIAVTLPNELWPAKLAQVLADGVRSGEVRPTAARRIILHDLRRVNANEKPNIRPRSVGAQRVIEEYAAAGKKIPRNDSPDALHADHYDVITKEQVAEIATVEAWVSELARMRKSIVCVTEAEHRTLAPVERQGMLGPEKYSAAGIEFVDAVPWA
jgi:hypothetical protein